MAIRNWRHMGSSKHSPLRRWVLWESLNHRLGWIALLKLLSRVRCVVTALHPKKSQMCGRCISRRRVKCVVLHGEAWVFEKESLLTGSHGFINRYSPLLSFLPLSLSKAPDTQAILFKQRPTLSSPQLLQSTAFDWTHILNVSTTSGDCFQGDILIDKASTTRELRHHNKNRYPILPCLDVFATTHPLSHNVRRSPKWWCSTRCLFFGTTTTRLCGPSPRHALGFLCGWHAFHGRSTAVPSRSGSAS